MRDIDFHSFIDSLSRVIEYKDFYTRGHSDRVAEIAIKTARAYGLDEATAEEIHIAGHLHDIGKIGIPDGILMKSGKLSPKEYSIMQDHSDIGYEIVKDVKGLSRVALYIKHHHERYDGRGYPAGLKGTEIPLGAAIIAVADSFDAMTTFRTYRQTICTRLEALEDIRRNMGKQFAPQVAEAFLAVCNEEEQGDSG